MSYEIQSQRICVTGGSGFLGRVVVAKLRELGVKSVFVPRRADFDLTKPADVERLYRESSPTTVIHLAAEVGGIGANRDQPGRFFFANMAMGLHLIEEARCKGVEKFVQVGTVCAYPKHCPPPFKETSLWDGFPEETNAPYGVAKRSLSTMLDAYRAQYGFNGLYLVPVNLYGPHDNFDLQTSHVIPALIRKFCAAVEDGAAEVECWGTGKVTREFLFVDDAAEAIVTATARHNGSSPINLGTGKEISISDLARRIARLCGFGGTIVWNSGQPDGQPRRRLDTSTARALLNWEAQTSLDDGLARTVDWWRAQRPVSAC